MNQDLKIIKNKYGEKMMHLCRELFPTILEKEGVLSQILLDIFEPSRFLYEDIIKHCIQVQFKSYIYSIFDSSFRDKINIEKTPSELLGEAGYILHECKTEEDIQGFRKYYKKGEELCTFRGERLDDCYVYFAVKKNVDEIKREDFTKPERQDLYGTSVISIQFTKDASHVLSIKNRYNHTVENPDATFSNDLDNIIEGLTDSFEIYYGMKQKVKSDGFEIPGYVMAKDGKYYKYNLEIDNVYYCPNNVIIDNFKVKKYPKEKYIVLDYFILDLNTGKIMLYDKHLSDSFMDTMQECDKAVVYKEGEYKKIVFSKEGQEPIIIILDKLNNIIGLENKSIKEIGAGFLYYNIKLEKLSLPNVEFIYSDFLIFNEELKELYLPNVKIIYDNFLYSNKELKEIDLPNVKRLAHDFLHYNEKIRVLNLPKVEIIGNYFLYSNKELKEIDLPNVKRLAHDFLYNNEKIRVLNLPKVEIIGNRFLYSNKELTELDLLRVKEIGQSFLTENEKLKEINIPNAIYIDRNFLVNNIELTEISIPNIRVISSNFLKNNEKLTELDLSNVEEIRFSFLYNNKELKEMSLPNVRQIDKNFLYHNKKLEKLSIPNVIVIHEDFLYKNTSLKQLNLPNVKRIYKGFLYYNMALEKLSIPNVEYIGFDFLYSNQQLKELELPNIEENSFYMLKKKLK